MCSTGARLLQHVAPYKIQNLTAWARLRTRRFAEIHKSVQHCGEASRANSHDEGVKSLSFSVAPSRNRFVHLDPAHTRPALAPFNIAESARRRSRRRRSFKLLKLSRPWLIKPRATVEWLLSRAPVPAADRLCALHGPDDCMRRAITCVDPLFGGCSSCTASWGGRIAGAPSARQLIVSEDGPGKP
jgi:hypothetical protein